MVRQTKRGARVSILTFPKTFRARQIAANGTKLYVRVGGSGPAVLLLHGYGETGDMWVPLADNLARDRTVVVPDLRGMGLSAKPPSGYDKKTQANDVAGILDELKVERAALVTHDIGNMVGYAFAAQYRHRVTRFVVIDAPLPGVGPWEEILKNPLLWHFRFGGPDMERLVAGRERIYLDRFWNEFSATPKRFSEAARRHFAKLYARPGAGMRASRSSRRSTRTRPITRLLSRRASLMFRFWRWAAKSRLVRRWPR
jgi:pimeloyl-ACP methyl ester carboxylesterase